MLTKTERIYTHEPQRFGPLERFAQRDEDTQDLLSSVWVNKQTFDDLGQPDQITVTIEPGDRLNG
jgi:hypothetical protein